MRHSHNSFAEAVPAKKTWTSPVLTSTELNVEELEFARHSNQNMVALGIRLKAEGRI